MRGDPCRRQADVVNERQRERWTRLRTLAADYAQMRVMIFGEHPEFARIIAVLHLLEDEINGLVS